MEKLPSANCDACPLRACGVAVPPERKSNPRLVIVGESPWKNEAAEGRPFCGASGLFLNDTLRRVGVQRSDAHVTNAVACYPGREMNEKEWKGALEACGPRLQRELDELHAKGVNKIVALGGKALSKLEGRKMGIVGWLGHPLMDADEQGGVFPIMHPAAVLRNPLLKELWRTCWQRAAKWLSGPGYGGLTWTKARIHIDPTDEALLALERMRTASVIGADVETGGKSPLYAPLLCLSVASPETGDAVSLKWPIESYAHEEALRALLADPAVAKTFHNKQHDLLTLESNAIVCAGVIHDTLTMHVAKYPGQPHNLSYATTQHITGPRWKSLFHDESELKGLEVFTKSKPEDLRTYNAEDSFRGALLYFALRDLVRGDVRVEKIVENLDALSDIAIDMRRRGVRVDLAKREEHRVELTESIAKVARDFALEYPEWQLGKNGAHPSLKKMFFERFGVTPLRRSKKTGKPKLDTWSLQMYRAAGGTVSRAAELILQYRKCTKLLTTYIEGLQVDPDGCVHPAWSVWGPISGRWACADPNLMNIPKAKELDLGNAGKIKLPGMRDMFVAKPGHTLVAADYEKLELWIVAALSGDEPLIAAWNEGKDVHTQNASDMFGHKPDDNERHFAKRFVYGANYDAKAETLHAAMVTEFPKTKLPHVRKLLMAWKAKHPKIFRMHSVWRKFVYDHGYIEIPISGLRVYYADEKQTVNLPVQGTAAVLANRAARAIAARGKASWLVIQCHDELVLEVPEGQEQEAAELLRETMSAPLELPGTGKSWIFPVEVKQGKNWGAMSKLKAAPKAA